MQNSEYWKLRFEQLEAAQNGQGAAAVAEIERQYKEAQSRLKGRLPAGISVLPTTTEFPLRKPANI